MKNPVGIGTMTSKGQITIPREIRKKLNLKQGEQLLFVAGEDEVLIRKIDKQDLIKSLYEKARQSEPEDIPLNNEEQEQMDGDEGYVSLEEAKRELGL